MLHGVVPSAGPVLKYPLLGPIPNDAITQTLPPRPGGAGEDPMARPGRAGRRENDAKMTPG